ncbi:MAG: GTP cyclohydrolase II [Candidatus Magasanikbacteria bacterium]|nr:GTP cyclohydrolase II [Candidatus Magasanikbacteria bacterium]
MAKVKAKKMLAQTTLPTRYGNFELYVFEGLDPHRDEVVITKGKIRNSKTYVPLRIHSSCVTGDIFGSMRCDCGKQLETALKTIQKKGFGMLIYLDQEGRGIGLVNKIKAYTLQDEGYDTVEANKRLGFASDLRNYDSVIEILRYFDIKKVELMTNNSEKIEVLKKAEFSVRRHPLWVGRSKYNKKYLATKVSKMKHLK